MADILIRDVPDATLLAIDALAQAAGKSRAQWLRDALQRASEAPLVAARYRIVGVGVLPGSGRAVEIGISRTPLLGVSGYEKGPGQEYMDTDRLHQAYLAATALAERNAPGDKERIITLLSNAGLEVMEKPVEVG